GWRSRRVTGAGLVASIRPSIIALTGRTKGNSTTRPPDKRQTLLGLARRRAAVTLDGAALFVIDANCHGPLSGGAWGQTPPARAPLVRGHGEEVPDFDRERRLPDLTEVFPVAAGSLIVFTAGNRISTRRPRAAAIRRSI